MNLLVDRNILKRMMDLNLVDYELIEIFLTWMIKVDYEIDRRYIFSTCLINNKFRN